MEIDLHNYEAFFLDHKEGNLSAKQEKQLFLFLEQYPHLYEELHDFENLTLETLESDLKLSNKNSLKKSDYSNETLIAYTENLLDKTSKNEIDTMALQNSALQKELKLYKSTIAIPDLDVKFKSKSKLKRGGLIIPLQSNYTFLRVAAALLLLVGLFFLVSYFNSSNENKNKVEVALVEPVNKKQEARDVKQEPRIKNQEVRSKKQDERYEVRERKSAGFAINKQKNNGSSVPVNSKQEESRSVVTNTLLANNINVKNIEKDSSIDKVLIAENIKKPENQIENGSYFNYSKDADDEIPLTASANTKKKSLFQKIVKVAKNVNNFGIKNVNAEEEENSNSVSIGNFVVSESNTNLK